MLALLFFLFFFTNAITTSSGRKNTTISCPPGILSTPAYGTTNAVFTVCSITQIHADASSVYEILIDFAAYDLWNSFVVHVAPTSSPFPAVNATMRFTTARLNPDNTTNSDEVITILDAANTVTAWRYDDRPTPGLLAAEHVSNVTETREGWSRYVSWETFYGPIAVRIQETLASRLQDAFEAQGEDLRVYAEKRRKRVISSESSSIEQSKWHCVDCGMS